MIWVALAVLVGCGLLGFAKLGRRIQWLNMAIVDLKARQQRNEALIDRLADRTGGPVLSVEERVAETADELERILSP